MSGSVPVLLSLGGNLGDVAASFDIAIAKLEEAGLCDIRRSSSYITEPVGCTPGTPDFMNMALSGTWFGSADELLRVCKKIEAEGGRPNDHEPYASRTIDVDIVLFGNEQIDKPELKIPHPELKKRYFVLIPAVEIVPDWKYPGSNTSLKEILDELLISDSSSYLQSVRLCKTGGNE